MTIEEAEKIVDEYEFKSVTTPDEDFMLTEAMEFLIDKTKDTKWMVRLVKSAMPVSPSYGEIALSVRALVPVMVRL